MKYEQYVREFRESLGARTEIPLAGLSPRDVRTFRDSLSKSGHSPTTVNGALKIIAGPFNAALRLGYLSTNPCVGVELLKDDADAEKDVFTPDHVSRLIAEATGDWEGAILAGYFTGLRLRDITELRWESVDLESAIIRVRTKKTGSIVVLPIHEELQSWIRQQTRGIGNAPVFPNLSGKSGGGKSGLSMQFRKIMVRAGIAGRILRQRKVASEGRTSSSLSFHSLRHSFNSALANAGVSQEIRQKLTGHASAAQNSKYTHHDLGILRAAVSNLPKVAKCHG